MNKKTDELITKAGIAINNSLQNEELQIHMGGFGYNTEKLEGGKTLLTSAANLNITQAKETGDKTGATTQRNKIWEQAHKVYMQFVKIARIAFVNEPGIWQSLGLSGDRKESFSGWTAQVNQFYTNLLGNAAWLEKMAGFGITAEKLNEGKALAEEVEDANNRLKTEMGEAQEATRLRDEAADTLQEWYSDFIAIARIALEDKPQLLEMLGIVKK